MSATFPKEARKNLLTRDGAADGSNWTIRLLKNASLTLSQDTVLTDLEEADFSGYAPIVSSAWGPAFIDGAGIAQRVSALVLFTHSGGLTGNNVTGYYMTHDVPGPSELRMVELFTAPIPMFLVTDQLPLRLQIGDKQGP